MWMSWYFYHIRNVGTVLKREIESDSDNEWVCRKNPVQCFSALHMLVITTPLNNMMRFLVIKHHPVPTQLQSVLKEIYEGRAAYWL